MTKHLNGMQERCEELQMAIEGKEKDLEDEY
jgi:hypothetical protein